MTVKTDISRFHVHDELTAPEGSVKTLKGSGAPAEGLRSSSASSPAAPRPAALVPRASPARGCALPPGHPRAHAHAISQHRSDPDRLPPSTRGPRGPRASGARRDLGRAQLQLERSQAGGDPRVPRGARCHDGRPPAPRRGGAGGGLAGRGTARGRRPGERSRVPEPGRERGGAAAGPDGLRVASERRLAARR